MLNFLGIRIVQFLRRKPDARKVCADDFTESIENQHLLSWHVPCKETSDPATAPVLVRPRKLNNNQPTGEHSMKLNRIITLCAMAAALTLSASDLLAQQDTGGNNNGGQGGGGAGGQGGGQRRNRQGGGPGGNFDPAA